jgi:undecaprenyl-diphosphatase
MKFVLAPVRRVAANLVRWCAALTRAPRAQLPRLGIGIVAVVVVGIAVIIASMFLFDTTATDWARHLPRGFKDIFEEITDYGRSGWFLYPLGFLILGLAVLISPALPRFTRGVLAALVARLGFLFIAIGLPSLFDTVVKRMIGRARPYVGGHDDPFAYRPFVWRPEYASLPSGHATTAAAAAIAIGLLWPRARGVMWLYALTIMFSRIVVMAHHPSDVLAGALVGGVGALMVRRYFAARGLVFDADLKARPWPSWRRLKAAAGRAVAGL